MDVNAVLDVKDLTRRFGAVVANDSIELRVRPGEVVGLLGHNGAGKTTLVSQIVGLLRPHDGTIKVAGVDAIAHPATARRCVALQPQGQAPLDGLTPKTAIEIAGRMRGMSRVDARRAARTLAEELDIDEWFNRRATPDGGGLSGGVRRLTAFAMAAVAPVPLIVLDEPTNDVDAARRRRLWKTVRRLGDEGAGVLLVTHNVVEAERLVDSLVVLDRGKVVAAGSPRTLRGSSDDDLRLELSLHPDGGHADAAHPYRSDPSESPAEIPVPIIRRTRAGRRVLLTLSKADAAAAVAWATALRASDRIEDYALAAATLEDAYLAVTGGDDARAKELADV